MKKIEQKVDPIVTEAIRKAVEMESLVEWAKREEVVDEEAMRKELPSTAWKPGHGFALQIFKYLQP